MYLTIVCVLRKCKLSLKGGSFELLLFGQFLQFFLSLLYPVRSPLLKVYGVCLCLSYHHLYKLCAKDGRMRRRS